MKKMLLAAFVAVAVTGAIASAGIASLADAATILIGATNHSDRYGSNRAFTPTYRLAAAVAAATSRDQGCSTRPLVSGSTQMLRNTSA